MRNNTCLVAILIISVLFTGCQKFDTLVNNPNLPTTSSPSLILPGVLVGMNDENAWTRKPGSQTANQYWISSTIYGGTNNYDQAPFTNAAFNYLQLQNVAQMEKEALASGASPVNPYGAIGSFLKAFYFHLMLQKFGEVPITNAFKGADDPTPAYNTQQEAYVQVFSWLEKSNKELASLIQINDASLSGDIYLGNSLVKWQQVVNSFSLRVLISLSKKENDPVLKVKDRFMAILQEPLTYPLMTGLSSNLQFRYNAQFNNYPKTPGSLGFDVSRENVSSTFLGLTTSLHDPRTFIAATPAPARLQSGKAFSDFAAYAGADMGNDMGTIASNATAGKYSYVNALRYYGTYDGSSAEPAIIIGYPELCFNIAEGINRGWATGDAGSWYQKGILAAMEHLGITQGSSITVGDIFLNVYGKIIVSLNDYLNQPAIIYAGDNADGLKQILTQKYLSFWQNSSWEAFFNQRRSGIPVFSVGPGTGNGGKIPLRWQYPFSERTANEMHYNESIDRQYGGVDDLNGQMWILK